MKKIRKLLEGEILPENAMCVIVKVGEEYELYGLDLDEHKEKLESAVKYLTGVCIRRALELQSGA